MVSTHSPRPGGGTHAVPPTPPSEASPQTDESCIVPLT
jgi:hypothetical protein